MEENNMAKRNPNNMNNINNNYDRRKTGKAKQYEVQQIRDELMNFARSEWGKRWVKAILEFGRPYRMQRGVRYAQEERIDNLTISSGMIFATVQGTAPTPYRTKILFDPIPEEQWEVIIDALSSKAYYTIQLLSGQLPPDITSIFEKHNIPLFPAPTKEFPATCSCPDYTQNKSLCKHVMATVLYVARVIDFDPFLLFKLRGKGKEDMLQELQKARSCAKKPVVRAMKQIRQKVNVAEKSFDYPTLLTPELTTEQFAIATPYKVGFHFSPPQPSIETLDNLSFPPNLESSEEFTMVFDDIYHTITREVYLGYIQQKQKQQKQQQTPTKYKPPRKK